MVLAILVCVEALARAHSYRSIPILMQSVTLETIVDHWLSSGKPYGAGGRIQWPFLGYLLRDGLWQTHGVALTLEKLEDLRGIARYGVMRTRRCDQRQGGACRRRTPSRTSAGLAQRLVNERSHRRPWF